MSLSSRVSFTLLPILNSFGDVYCWEFSRDVLFQEWGGVHVDYRHLEFELKKRVFLAQLSSINSLPASFSTKRLVSINIDFSLARFISQNTFVQSKLSSNPLIRLVFDYDLSQDDNLTHTRTLKKICLITPLWLNEFGAGGTNLTMLSKFRFNVIKIDGCFYKKHSMTKVFFDFIEHTKAYCRNIVICGVENQVQLQEARMLFSVGCSGNIWEGLTYNISDIEI